MTQAPPPTDLKLQRSSRDASTVPGAARGVAGHAPARGRRAGWCCTAASTPTACPRRPWSSTRPGPRTAERTRGSTSRGSRRPPTDVPGLPGLRPAGPVRRHADRRRAHRRAGPDRRASWSRPARCSGTPFFLMDRIEGVVPPDVHALQLRRQLALRRRTRGPAPAPGRIGQACSPGCTRSRTPQTTFGFLDPGRHLTVHAGATPLERNLARTPRVVRVRGPRHRPLADRRARPRLAGGQPAGRPRRRPC